MPAGDPEKLRYAFAYGADAAYAGMPLFSLRARENGFKEKSVLEAIEYSRSLNKKLYLTMNIYSDNSRIERFLNSFCLMHDAGADGFIMSDIGLIQKALKLRPNAVIHLSTQANTSNWASVEFWRDLGVKRIVLSRELSIKEIAEIHHKVPDIELEVFVHGSICIAYSGRCLISNYLTHRSANEGTCTNSCRWQYTLGVKKGSLATFEENSCSHNRDYTPINGEYYVTEGTRTHEQYELDEDEHGTYMMNSKDLCAIELLKELKEAGVISFKVEGRTKSLFYVAMVARAYRRAIDDLEAGRPFDKSNLLEVASTANRTLMTGFLLRRPQEYGQNYTDGGSLPLTHRYAGQVLKVDESKNLALVMAKNPLNIGQIVEWVSPKGVIPLAIEKIFNESFVEESSLYGGNKGWLPCPAGTDTLSLLRNPIEGALDDRAEISPSELAI